MLQKIPLGLYHPGNSLLHRLQARTKLLILLWLIAFLGVASQRKWHFAPFAIAAIFVCLGIALSSVSLRYFWQRMGLLVLLTILGAFPTLLFASTHGKKLLYTLGPFVVPYSWLNWATLISGVLVAVYLLLWLLPTTRVLRQHPWFRRIRFVLLFIAWGGITFLLFIPSNRQANALAIGPIPISQDAVWRMVSSFTVFLVLYAFSLLLTVTTAPVALIEGLSLLLTPLRRLRLPVDEFALMTLLALRFFPTLIEEVEQLIKAQTARGADVSQGTLRERLQSLTTFFVPLMQGALRRANDLATALEARGYEVEGHQTLLYETSLGLVDYGVLSAIVLVTIGALCL